MNARFLAAALVLSLTAAAPPRDPRIVAFIGVVSAANLRHSVDTLVGFGTRNDFSDQTSTSTHGVFGARDWIVKQFQAIATTSGGRLTVRTDDYLQAKTERTPRSVQESSVVATLQGDEPGRTYVLSSHYDDCDGDCTDGLGVAPGADDNGSSVAAVLEAARILAPHHFRGTIMFVCFDGEELGLWGSGHLADELKAAHAPILAVLNNDIIGNSHGGDGQHEPNVVRVFSEAIPAGANDAAINAVGSENDSPSRELARFIGETVPVYLPGFQVRQIFRADRFLRGGDQESFQADGFAAIRFVEPHENFTHQHQNVRVENGVQFGDLPQYNDYDYLAQTTRANIAVLATLALGPAPPGNVQMVVRHLGYDTTLRWTAAANATAYDVVWRTTDATQWQHAQRVSGLTATVPLSKDDYIFGVRSVDSDGLRSPAVYPLPTRE
jgi:hypothetical protein